MASPKTITLLLLYRLTAFFPSWHQKIRTILLKPIWIYWSKR